MRANGKIRREMALANNLGLTEQSMRANGKTTWLKARGNSFTQMVTLTMVNGKMGWRMVLESVSIRKVENMKAIGWTTCRMATARNIGLTGAATMAILKKA